MGAPHAIMKNNFLSYLVVLACICFFSCGEKQKHGSFLIVEGVGTGENFTMPYKQSDGVREGDTLSVTKYGWGWEVTKEGGVPDRKVVFLGPKK